MSYFWGLRPPFALGRKNSPPSSTSPTTEEVIEPFIPDFRDIDGPLIPNDLLELAVYRYRSSRGAWKHVTSEKRRDEDVEDKKKKDKTYPTSVKVVTWNVDFNNNHEMERLTACLRHLEKDVLGCKDGEAPAEPCVILLQEVKEQMIPHLLQDEWVRRHFMITPKTKDKWPKNAYYGNITLVSKDLTVVKAQILHYGYSTMQRSALAVSIAMGVPESGGGGDTVVCIVNTHLESLPAGADARPRQLELCTRFLKQDWVQGGMIAGDMNAIGPSDAMITNEVGMRDAWRKGNKDETGFTWGYQGGGNFAPNRLDKMLYLPRRGYKVDEPRRIGVGVKAKSGSQAIWASDHYGLETTLTIVRRPNDCEFVTLLVLTQALNLCVGCYAFLVEDRNQAVYNPHYYCRVIRAQFSLLIKSWQFLHSVYVISFLEFDFIVALAISGVLTGFCGEILS